MSIGFWEMAIILVALLLMVKPDKAEEYAKNIGSFIRGIKDVKEEAEEIVKEVK